MALSELYDQLADRVYEVAQAIVGDTSDAEEIVTDTFVQVWRSAGSFDPERGSIVAWVATIARSRALDRRRKRIRREHAGQGQIPAFEAPDSTQRALARVEVAKLGPVLSEMAADQRRAIELAYFGGLTHSEIAAETGAPLGTVKTRIRSGMQLLRAALTEEEAS